MSLRVPYMLYAGKVTLFTPEYLSHFLPEENLEGRLQTRLQSLFETIEANGGNPRMGTLLGEKAEKVRSLANRLVELEESIIAMEREFEQREFYGVEEADAINEVLDQCSSVRVQIDRLIQA